jgi:hypothetical protein
MPAPLTLTLLVAAVTSLFVSGWLSVAFCIFAVANEIALAIAAAALVTPESEEDNEPQ